MTPQDFRKLMPVTQKYAYLNHAARGPLPTPALKAMGLAIEWQASLGSIWNFYVETIEAVRSKVAKLIGATADEIAFTQNTAQGLSLVASGIRWQRGDNVVTNDQEYPTNIYPWLNLKSRGVTTKLVPIPDKKVTAERLIEAVDDKTRAIAVSFVQFASGYRVDLKTLGKFCREQGIYLIVDGIQGVGVLPLNVTEWNIDFLACGGHKWLLGPFGGTGFLYLRKPIWQELELTNVGYFSVIPHGEHFLNYSLVLRNNARRFEGGPVSLVNLKGFEASLELLLAVGVPEIEAHVIALTDRLSHGLQGKGWRLYSPRNAGECSGIISFSHPTRLVTETAACLEKAKIIASVREGNLVRFSPHYYNTEEEIDLVISLL